MRPTTPLRSRPSGISVDLGTSTIMLHILDLANYDVLTEVSSQNPQNEVALDLVSRIRYSSRGTTESAHMTNLLRREVDRLGGLALRFLGLPTAQITASVVVGNSVMQRMFLAATCDELTSPPYLLSSKDETVCHGGDLGMTSFGSAQVYFPPLVESFIGSDAIANIIASSTLPNDGPMVLLDIGTNTEILLLNDGLVWAASAASGPAFEGMSLECGMPAIPGAIYEADISDSLSPQLSVISRKSATGICGSGIVSIIDELRRVELVNELGSFTRSAQCDWITVENDVVRYVLQKHSPLEGLAEVHVSQIDIRMVQQSKAAIQGGILCLLNTAKVSLDEISSILVTGAFGDNLDLQAAARIGMIPQFANANVTQRVGLALQGADMMLLDPNKRLRAKELAEHVEYVPLMDNPVFEELYSLSQTLRPWTST